MTIRFIADADLNQKIIDGLKHREPSISFLKASEGGTLYHPDPAVIRIAAESGRVLVSHDLETMPRHFWKFMKSNDSPGLILIPQKLRIGRAVEALLMIWAPPKPRSTATTFSSFPDGL